MKLRINKNWTKIPCDKIVTLYLPYGTEILIESSLMDTEPETDGVLYRENKIPLSTDKFLWCKLPKGDKNEEIVIDYVNFI